MDTLEHPKIKDWLAECRTVRTRRTYASRIIDFFKYYTEGVDAFLKLPSNEKRHVAILYQNARKGKFSPNSINGTLGALNSFLDMHDMKINFKGKRVRRTMDLNSHNFSNSDLAKMFELGNTKEKALLALAVSLGWEVSAVLGLERKRLQSYVNRAKEEGAKYFYFTDQRSKTGVPRLGILNPLALEWLEKWLWESRDIPLRKRWGTETRDRVVSDVFDITAEGANKILSRLAREAHIKTTGRIHFHKLRSWVISGLSRSGFNEFQVKFAVGKAIPMSDYTYLQTIQEQIEEKYPEAYESYLNIQTPVKAVAELTKSLEEKSTELEELRAKVAEIEGGRAGLEALLKRVLELEKKLNEHKNQKLNM
ncbi:MAG: hypothetical protein ACXACA_04690 [Candidatus Ranarchaeia archaeon]|jgi:hypothetical protein